MMVIAGAQSLLGRALVAKLNNQNFNYLVLAEENQSDNKEWLAETQYWHKVSNSDLPNWIEQNAEEIEFIICCSLITNKSKSTQFNSLWKSGYQHQIPIIGIGTSEKEVKEIMLDNQPPFFWTILLTENLKTKPEVSRVAQAIYYYIRNRQNSGLRTLDKVPSE